MKTKQPNIADIDKFTGKITSEQLMFVDSFVSEKVALFLPVAGPCQLAISHYHIHPSYMFVVNLSNSVSIVLKEGIFGTKSNQVFFLPYGVPHHETCDEPIPRYVAIMVQPEFMEQQAEFYRLYKPDLTSHRFFPASEGLLQLTKKFIGEYKLHQSGWDVILEAIGVEVVHTLLRLMVGIGDENKEQTSRGEIDRCIEYMRQNLQEKHTLQSLASYSTMSVSHFTRLFRKETGASPIEYLISMRLDVASRRLMEGTEPIKQIAMDCGFSSPAHFTAAFQQKFKIAPSEYFKLK